MEALRKTKHKIVSENVSHLGACEEILIVRLKSYAGISKIQETCIHLFQINHLVNY